MTASRAHLLAAVFVATLPAMLPAPAADDAKPEYTMGAVLYTMGEESADLTFESLNQSFPGYRNNGARLNVAASVEGRGEAAQLALKWSLDYTGPRNSLIVVRPELSSRTNGQTSVDIYFRGDDGKVYRVAIAGARVAGDHTTPREGFVVVPKGKQSEGRITLPLTQILRTLREQHPLAIRRPVNELRARLSLFAIDRGESFELDAWVGDLFSSVCKVALPQD